jgi:hypothetical protein
LIGVYPDAAFRNCTAAEGLQRFSVMRAQAIVRLKLTRFRAPLTVIRGGMALACQARRHTAGTRLAGKPVAD